MQKILILEDDPHLREFMGIMFGSDYKVLTSPTPLEALKELENHPDIVAVIADKDGPKKEGLVSKAEEVGLTLLETVQRERPTIKRILMSGRYPDPPLPANFVHAFWPKPFEMGWSLEQLRSIIG